MTTAVPFGGEVDDPGAARSAAQKLLSSLESPELPLRLFPDEHITDCGWAFIVPFESRRWFDDGDLRWSVATHGPIVVPREHPPWALGAGDDPTPSELTPSRSAGHPPEPRYDRIACALAADAALGGTAQTAIGEAMVSTLRLLEERLGGVFEPRPSWGSIIAELQDGGPGSRGIAACGVRRPDGGTGVGVVLNVMNREGAIAAIDAQTGTFASPGEPLTVLLLRTG
jgi:hypothetical protein